MKSGFFIFLSAALLIWTASNIYIFNSLKHAFRVPAARKIFTAVFVFLALSFLAGRMIEKYSYSLSVIPITAGSFFIAFVLYAFLSAAAADIINWAALIFVKNKIITPHAKSIFVLSASFLFCAAGFINSFNFAVKEIKVVTDKPVPDGGFKIAYASDLHLGHMVGKFKLGFLVDKFNSWGADAVVLGGDTIDEDIEPVKRKRLNKKLAEIKSKTGTYAVLGNHEYIGGYIEAEKYLTLNGIKIIKDASVEILPGLVLAGRDDASSVRMIGKSRAPLSRMIDGSMKDKFIILIDHQPSNLKDAEMNGVDLQLSGHTHHGQMFPVNFITSLLYELSAGFASRGKTAYYVSSGFGTWGPPVRLFRRPEVVLIKVVPSGR